MNHTYLVVMPLAEARHLAGTGQPWPPGPEARALAAVREWAAGISRRRAPSVPVRQIVADLTAILATVLTTTTPVRGPFAPPTGRRPPLPGTVEYLGDGTVRLDDTALSSLAGLPPDDDFHVTHTDAGPVLTVGADHYLAREEEADPKPD